MKKFDMSKHIGNIDEDLISDALSYKPRGNVRIRFIALAACIAIIATSVPLGVILNKKDATINHQEENKIVNDKNTASGYEDIQLENGTFKLSTIKTSHGKILKDSVATEKYVYEHDPFNQESSLLSMASNALEYHDAKSFNYKEYSTDKIIIGNSLYQIYGISGNVTRIVASDYEEHNSRIIENKFINSCIKMDGFEPGTIKIPKDATSEDIFELLSDQIDTCNRLLVENLDSCWLIPYEDGYYSTRRLVILWDSSNQLINDTILHTIQKNEGKDIDEWITEYQNIIALGFRIDLITDSDDYVKEIECYEREWETEVFHLDYENIMEDKIHYLSPKIDKYYVCGSNDQELLACAWQLEQYLIDVFKISGLTDSYTINTSMYNFQPSTPNRVINNFGRLGTKTLKIKLTPTPNHQNDYVTLSFETMDAQTYYLTRISTKYCLGGDNYVKLKEKDSAISYLAMGVCIGNIDLGCDVCRNESRKEIKEYIAQNLTCELVTLPNVTFELKDGNVIYDLPFYEFTSCPDENGNVYVAYVLAVASSGDYNLNIDIGAIESFLGQINLEQCPNYQIHEEIIREKKKK